MFQSVVRVLGLFVELFKSIAQKNAYTEIAIENVVQLPPPHHPTIYSDIWFSGVIKNFLWDGGCLGFITIKQI